MSGSLKVNFQIWNKCPLRRTRGEIMEKSNSNVDLLGTEPIGKLMARFAVPSIIALVVNSLYNMVDQVFIGNGVGYLGNAATNVILPVMMAVLAVGLMLGDGCAAFMGLNIGKGEQEKATKGVGNAVVLTILFGICFGIICQLLLEPLCWMFGATEQSISYCLAYGRPIILGFPFLAIDMSFASIIRADGRANVGLIGMLIGCVANIILDPIFIFVCHWGVAGAGWATIAGQILNAIYFLVCITKCKSITLKKEHLKLSGKIIGKICLLGIASFITQFALVIVIGVTNNTLKKYGEVSKYGADIPVSTMGIVMKVSQILTSIVLGLATGILPIISYNYGSRKYDRVKSLYKRALLISTCVMFVSFLILEIFPEQIVGIFGKQDPLYMEFAQKCMQTYLLAIFTVGASIVTGIFLQAVDCPIQSMLLSLLRQIVILVPAVLILGAVGGVTGILWAGPISDTISCIASLLTLGVCWKKIFEEEETK